MRSVRVAVVGAGPAGSSAAVWLRRRGLAVTLLDRARFPREKVCGDGCTPRARWMLERLGVRDLPADEAAPVDSVHLAAPGGASVTAPLPADVFGGRALVVERSRLDARLVRLAAEEGAEVLEGVPVAGVERDASGVTLRLPGGAAVRADVVLGCDGSPSIVRRAVGAPPFPPEHGAFAIRAYHERVRLTRPSTFQIFWERDLLPAYGWVFPLPGGRANVGVGLRADHLAKSRWKLPDLLEEFCRRPRVAAELEGSIRAGRPKGHHIPAGSFARHLVHDRALLLGDAAGFVNPLTGEGIEYALESGELAAETIAEAAAAHDFGARGLERYATRCHDRFAHAFRANHRLQQLFGHPRLVDHVVAAAARSTRVYRDLAHTLLGHREGISPRLAAAALLGR